MDCVPEHICAVLSHSIYLVLDNIEWLLSTCRISTLSSAGVPGQMMHSLI